MFVVLFSSFFATQVIVKISEKNMNFCMFLDSYRSSRRFGFASIDKVCNLVHVIRMLMDKTFVCNNQNKLSRASLQHHHCFVMILVLCNCRTHNILKQIMFNALVIHYLSTFIHNQQNVIAF